MKTIYIFLIIVLTTATSSAQQLALQSQYMINKFTINPAFAGTQKGIPVHISTRRQWTGIREAPLTQYLSVNGNLGEQIGVGLTLYNESTGPTRRTGIGISGAYQLTLAKSGRMNYHQLSFGGSAILSQHTLDKTKLETYLPDDPTIIGVYQNQLLPDVNFGAYYHNSDRYYIAISAFNLIQTKSDIFNFTNKVDNNFVRNYYLMAGYNIEIGNQITVQPNVLVRTIEALTTQFDINTRVIIDSQYWAGISYRNQESIIAMIGIKLKGLELSYSYDIVTSDIKTYGNGSHELHLGYRINVVNNGKKNMMGENFF